MLLFLCGIEQDVSFSLMGASGNWLKSLISADKAQRTIQEKEARNRKKKWPLRRSPSEEMGSSSSRSHTATSERSRSSSMTDDEFASALTALIRARPRDFIVVKREWAAIHIQAAFRGFLARRALKALRSVVRLQAIFRGRQVRKQAAATLRRMQTLVRVQGRVQAKCVHKTSQGKGEQRAREKSDENADPNKMVVERWRNPGSGEEVRTKIQMRQEGAIKRERAIASAFSRQQPKFCANPSSSSKNKQEMFFELNKVCPGWSFLDDWMDEIHSAPVHTTSFSRKSSDRLSDYDSMSLRRGTSTSQKLSRNPTLGQLVGKASSKPSDDESMLSASSSSRSLTDFSSTTLMTDKEEESYYQKLRCASLTKPIKANQNSILDSPNFRAGSLSFTRGDVKSTLPEDLYPPMLFFS